MFWTSETFSFVEWKIQHSTHTHKEIQRDMQ
jgi:hypothetical protein